MKKLLTLLLVLLLLTGCGPATPGNSSGTSDTATDPAITDKLLQVHFIDVGQADCALVTFGDFAMLIDGGNKEDSSLVVSYLQKQGIEELDAVVCSHAHEDHVGGLPGVLAVFPTAAVYAPTRTYSSDIFEDFLYYADQQGLQVTIPVPGDTISAEGLTVTFLGPVESYAETNNTSLILRIDHGESSFLFTGDMETEAEGDMLDYWGDEFNWSVDVLKVGHHGSDTSTGYRFLRSLMPAFAVISVGKGNSYGHPHELPLSRLEAAGCAIYRTDELGTILATSDGENITFTWKNGQVMPETPETEATEGESQLYIGNKNSKKLHLPTCKSLPSEKNQVIFDSYEEAIAAGYTPCSNCMN